MINEPFFKIVLGKECGLPRPLLVGYGRSSACNRGFTEQEIHTMLARKLRKIYQDTEKYGVTPGGHVLIRTPLSLLRTPDGHYQLNAETVALQVPSY